MWKNQPLINIMELVNLDGGPVPVGAAKDILENFLMGNDQSEDLRETCLWTFGSIIWKKKKSQYTSILFYDVIPMVVQTPH